MVSLQKLYGLEKVAVKVEMIELLKKQFQNKTAKNQEKVWNINELKHKTKLK